MVPVSDTTQDLNADAAGALLDELLDALELGVELPPELDPHAAASMATALSPAMLASFALTVALLCDGGPTTARYDCAADIHNPSPTRAGSTDCPLWDAEKVSGDGAGPEA
jgi:hypothetical protein